MQAQGEEVMRVLQALEVQEIMQEITWEFIHPEIWALIKVYRSKLNKSQRYNY